MAEPPALRRALDEPGDVGEDELVVAEPHDAEVGLEGGERVVGDLGLGRADRGDQRRLARRSGTRRARRRRGASPRAGASAPRRTRPARRSRARGGRWRGNGRCPARPGRRGRRGSGRRGAPGRRARSPSRARTMRALGDGDDEVVAAGAVALVARRRACPTRPGGAGWSRKASSEATLRSARSDDVAAVAAVAAVGAALGRRAPHAGTRPRPRRRRRRAG